MTDRSLTEVAYRHAAEVRDLAQEGLDALAREDVEACRKALLELLASVDRFNRYLFACGSLQEGNTQAASLDELDPYTCADIAARRLLKEEEARQALFNMAGIGQ